MVQSFSNGLAGCPRRTQKSPQPERGSALNNNNDLLPSWYGVDFQDYRATTVSAEVDEGVVSISTRRNPVPSASHSKPTRQLSRQLDGRIREDETLPASKDVQRARPRPYRIIGSGRKVHNMDTDAVTEESSTRISMLRLAPDLSGRRGRSPASRQNSQVDASSSYTAKPNKADQSSDDAPKKRANVMRSFRIDNEDEVTNFLEDRLRRMLQVPAKQICKAWIKGICPKKQALSPYQNSKKGVKLGKLKPSEVIGWWPAVERCRYIEPDHIKRDERQILIMHLLRLRPQPEVLMAWNKGKSEPSYEYGEWTALLKKLTPESIFQDIKGDTAIKKERRWKWFMELYDVAEMEEQYKCLGMGGDQIFQYSDETPEAPIRKTRKRKSVVATVESDVDADADVESPAAHDDNDCKRRRRASSTGASSSVDEKLTLNMSGVELVDDAKRHLMDLDEAQHTVSRENQQASVHQARWRAPAWTLSASPRDQQLGYHDGISMATGWPPAGMWLPASDYPMGAAHPRGTVEQYHASPWQSCEVSPTTSFDSSTINHVGAHSDLYSAHQGISTYSGQQDFMFPAFANASSMATTHQAHMAAHVPVPHFDTVPNTPVFSPMTVTPQSNVDVVPQQAISEQQTMPVATGTIPSQAFPFLGSYDRQQAPPQPLPQMLSHHGLPMYYPNEVTAPQQQSLPLDFDGRHVEAAFEAAAWNYNGFTGHSSGVGGGQPT